MFFRIAMVCAVLAVCVSIPLGVLAAPTQQTFGPGPVIYEPNVGFGGLQFRDSSSFDVRGSLSAPLYNVSAVEHSSDGAWLFVAQDNIVDGRIVGSLTLVDLVTGQVLDTINFPFLGLSECRPNSLAVLPGNNKVYVACGVNGFVEVVNVNPTTGQLSRSTPFFTGYPQSAHYANGFVWVANHQGTNLVRIDPINDTAQAIVNTSPFLMDEAVVDPLRPYAYISHIFNNRLLIASLTNGQILRTLSLAGEPIDLLISPDGERLYVTVDNGEGNGQDHIAIIEGLGGSEQVVATIPVGEAATYLATNDEGSCLFTWELADGGRRYLDVIDTAFNQLSAQPIIAGSGANGDFVAPGASPQALFLEPNAENSNFFSVLESSGAVRLHVRRGCASQGTVQVNYATQDPSGGDTPAVANVDYQPVSGVLTFAPGEVLKTIEIPLIDNMLYGQSTRAFDLALSAPDGAFLGNRFLDTIQIEDDDSIPAGTDLQLSLADFADPIQVGEALTYYAEVRNTPSNLGNDVATSVVVTVQLPANVGFVNAAVENNPGGGGGDFLAARAATLPDVGQCDTPAAGQSGTVVCTVGDVNPTDQGAYGAVTLHVQVLPDAVDSTLTASASVGNSSFDPFPANNSATTTTVVEPAVNNQPPVAVDDSANTTSETSVTIPVLNNDSDADGDPLTVSTVGAATGGQVSTDGTTVFYTPNPTFTGNDSFSYTISDGRGGNATATVNVLVTPATRITIVLDNRPDTDQNVRFTGRAPIRRFILDDNTPQDADAYSNSRSFDLAPGTYVITEAIPTNRLLTAITCMGGNTSVDLASGAVSITLASGEQVTCTFVNERPVTIRGRAYEDRNRNGRRSGAEPFLAGWDFTLYRSNTTSIVASAQTDSSTLLVSFTPLPAGDYTLCETLQPGWINSDPAGQTAPYNQPCRLVTLTPGQTATLLFGNYPAVAPAAADAALGETGDEELSVQVEEEALTDENMAEADAQWLAEESALPGATYVFLPLLRR